MIIKDVLRRQYVVVGMLTLCMVLMAVIGIFFGPSQSVGAENTAATKSKGLTLSPLRTELDIAPGTSLDGMLTVTNNSSKPMSVAMSAEVFSVINQQYDYAFTAESNVVQWVSFDHTEISLQPGKSQDVKYMVGVPLSAEPGGRYISLFASTRHIRPNEQWHPIQTAGCVVVIHYSSGRCIQGRSFGFTYISLANRWR
jgi:hypothetical protein